MVLQACPTAARAARLLVGRVDGLVLLGVWPVAGLALLPDGDRARAEVLPLLPAPRARRRQAGQATTEYALVLLGAAAVALLLVAWATRTGAFGSLLDAVMDSIKKKV